VARLRSLFSLLYPTLACGSYIIFCTSLEFVKASTRKFVIGCRHEFVMGENGHRD
jgi:hypothetical protein